MIPLCPWDALKNVARCLCVGLRAAQSALEDSMKGDSIRRHFCHLHATQQGGAVFEGCTLLDGVVVGPHVPLKLIFALSGHCSGCCDRGLGSGALKLGRAIDQRWAVLSQPTCNASETYTILSLPTHTADCAHGEEHCHECAMTQALYPIGRGRGRDRAAAAVTTTRRSAGSHFPGSIGRRLGALSGRAGP
jgi:hypothetical protein